MEFRNKQILSHLVNYSTSCRKDLIFSCPVWIFHFFHATKPPNSQGFCMELAGVTREFLHELQEIFLRNSRMVTRDAWSLLQIPEDRSFQHHSQKSREECEENRSRVHSVVLLYNIKRLSLLLIISSTLFLFWVYFLFSFTDDGYSMKQKRKYQHKNVKCRCQNTQFLILWE